MDRAAVSQLPKWERDLLYRSGVQMLGVEPTQHAQSGYQESRAPQLTREDVLTKTAEELGMA